MNAEPIVLVPYGSDPLETLAALMLQRHQRDLPDLSRHVALFPRPGAIPYFRRHLLAAASARGLGGVLAPWCGTLDGWLAEQADENARLIDNPERDLLLLEALDAYPSLRERYGTWTLIDSLLALFDELNTYPNDLSGDVDALTTRLARGYGLTDSIDPLNGEARLVHSLWNAWNAHLRNHGLHDRTLRRRLALANRQRTPDRPYHIYIVGVIELTLAESDWLKTLQADGRATLVLHGGVRDTACHPDVAVRRCFRALGAVPPAPAEPATPYERFIESIYADDADIGARARSFAADIPQSPLADRLRVYGAADFEQEARSVELAVRRWYARGIFDVGIVTPDRKLARRVRALLERANVSLRDVAGWALSTTSAATALMRWIECVEEDFAQAPLLDFLKSPFVTLGFVRTDLDAVVHHVEEHLIRRYNIGAGLDRYRRALRARQPVAANDPIDIAQPAANEADIVALLDRLAAAAAPLLAQLGSRRRSAFGYLSALQTSLERTGLAAGLAADAAGSQLLAALHSAQSALGAAGASLSWSEFRDWLQRELERRRFHPPLAENGVDLLDLAESRCRRYEALIIAGCTRDNLPDVPGGSPFFNDGVRATLGLPTREDRLAAPLHDFRRLLQAAPRILLTWREMENGENIVPSPWTERIVAFHRLAYGGAPTDTELAELLTANETTLYRHDVSPPPRPATMPAPRLPPARVPLVLHQSGHQRLLDCPYQFYAVEGLGLRALDEVRDEMEKSDYGRNVHRILHAFHTGAPGLPGPWTGGAIDPNNRTQAAALLRELGRRVFGYDADRRLSTRGWHHRWETFVATYLDWQQKRAQRWGVEATEISLERTLALRGRTLLLRGRVDRVDRGAEGLAIIDYKTGKVPPVASVRTGEKAQLPFYALLHPGHVAEVLYAELQEEPIKTGVRVADDELGALLTLLEARLRALIESIDAGAPLPAWGDADTCRFCRYEGLCRKEMWSTEPPNPTSAGKVAGNAGSRAGEQMPLFPSTNE